MPVVLWAHYSIMVKVTNFIIFTTINTKQPTLLVVDTSFWFFLTTTTTLDFLANENHGNVLVL